MGQWLRGSFVGHCECSESEDLYGDQKQLKTYEGPETNHVNWVLPVSNWFEGSIKNFGLDNNR